MLANTSLLDLLNQFSVTIAFVIKEKRTFLQRVIIRKSDDRLMGDGVAIHIIGNIIKTLQVLEPCSYMKCRIENVSGSLCTVHSELVHQLLLDQTNV